MSTRRILPHLSAVALVGACLSGTAAADFMKLDVQVRTTGLGEPWSDSVNVSPDTDVDVRFVISVDRTAGWLTWAGCTLTQLDVGSSSASDSASNFAGLISSVNHTFQLWDAGTSSAKIDRVDNPGASIQMSQLPPNQGALPDNPIVTFSFRYHVGADLALRDTTLSAAPSRMSLALVYITEGGATASIPAANRTIDGAVIHVTPAPASVLAFGALGLARRRR